MSRRTMLNDGQGDGRAAGSTPAAQAGAQPETASDRPGSQAQTDEQSVGARAGPICCHHHDRLHDSAPCPPARVLTVTAHCPGAVGNGTARRHWVLFSGFSAARKVLPATSSLSASASILPPETTSTSASIACTRAVRALCATMVMTSTLTRPRQLFIDHLREHQAAGHHIPDDAIADLQADAAENDAWIKSDQGARIADHDHRSRRRPTC
jgi:hypothetical protein